MKKVAIITSAFGYGLTDREQVYAPVFYGLGLNALYCSREELMHNSKGVQGVIVGVEKADAEFFSACPDLQVAMKFGVGLDNFDRTAAELHNVVVANLPGINSDAVAEMTIALILSVSRGICVLNRSCTEGSFTQLCTHSLFKKTLGLIGMGAIGTKVAQMSKVFGMHCISHDPFVSHSDHAQMVDFQTVLTESDIISIHIPLTEENYHLLDATCFQKMKRGAVLINASRGGIVDEEALADSIQSGHLGGAGIDVYESRETISKLIGLDSVVCTPHVAAYTHETLRNMEDTSIRKMATLLSTNKSNQAEA